MTASISSTPSSSTSTGLALAFCRALAQSAGWHGLFGAMAAIAGAVAESVGLVLLIPILHLLTGQGEIAGRWLHGWTHDQLLPVLLGGFLAVMVARALTLYLRDMLLWRLENDFLDAQRNRVMRRLANARWAAVAPLHHAEIQTGLSTEMMRLAVAVRFFVQSIVAAVLILIQGGLAMALAPGLAGILLSLIVVGGLVLARPGHADRLGRDFARTNLALMQGVGNLLSGLKAALAQNLQHRFVEEFERAQARVRGNRFAFARRQARTRLAFALGSAAAACALILGGMLVFHVDPPVLILLILIFARLTGPLASLQQALQQFAYNLPAFGTVIALEARLGVEPAPAAATVPGADGPVILSNLSFRHGQGAGVEDVSLTIEPGEHIAITGDSGSGKTTMLDLLAGLILPERGVMLAGGIPLDGAALPAWRDAIAYVVQDPFLFHDSVRGNLAVPDGHDDAAIWEALEAAEAAALVLRLDQGLETPIGERGTLLSGGERQRIAIARALLRRPRLLMFDEATNALDIPAERRLLERLAARRPRPALVAVTHRRENLDLFDRVFVMESGRLHMVPPRAS